MESPLSSIPFHYIKGTHRVTRAASMEVIVAEK